MVHVFVACLCDVGMMEVEGLRVLLMRCGWCDRQQPAAGSRVGKKRHNHRSKIPWLCLFYVGTSYVFVYIPITPIELILADCVLHYLLGILNDYS
jgi:hypothetical protein